MCALCKHFNNVNSDKKNSNANISIVKNKHSKSANSQFQRECDKRFISCNKLMINKTNKMVDEFL